MFRIVEFIGRWSMLDIFVIALLGSYVNFSFLTSIHTAPAATYFCLVVITTMLAAITFDPRLMWDLTQKDTTRIDAAERPGD
jgi:paraquat-inducible protein A